MRIKINHPLANYISIQNSELSHSADSTSEIAFFIYKGNIREFQTTVLEEFSKYAEETEGDTLVYSYVPNELIDQFVEKYRTTPCLNRLHDLMSSSEEGRRRLAAARLRREVLVNLESALEESGMTQSALASALGRTRSAVNQVFGGDGNIRISTLAEYLHAMGQELVLTRVPEGATRARLWRDGADTVAQTVVDKSPV